MYRVKCITDGGFTVTEETNTPVDCLLGMIEFMLSLNVIPATIEITRMGSQTFRTYNECMLYESLRFLPEY